MFVQTKVTAVRDQKSFISSAHMPWPQGQTFVAFT